MKEITTLLISILKSLFGIAMILVGIMFAEFQLSYVALPLAIIGALVCFFSYLNIKGSKEAKNEEPKGGDEE